MGSCGRSSSPTSLPSREAWIEIAGERHEDRYGHWSLPSREAWIEIDWYYLVRKEWIGRFPRGKRGLKYVYVDGVEQGDSRFPRGKRGLKYQAQYANVLRIGRFPRGKRGLKSKKTSRHSLPFVSLPSREAWIEIYQETIIKGLHA